MRSTVRRALVRALLVWSIPAAYMATVRVIEILQHGAEVTYLTP